MISRCFIARSASRRRATPAPPARQIPACSRRAAVRGNGKSIAKNRVDAARVRRQHDDSRGEKHRLGHRMRHKHRGPFLLRAQAQQFFVQAVARHFIERGEGLVHQQKPRTGGQRARDRDAHLHAAGKFARIGLGHVLEARPARAVPRSFLARRILLTPSSSRPEADILRPRCARAAASHPEKCRRPFRARSSASCRRRGWFPALGAVRPEINFSTVDLPQPEGPMRADEFPLANRQIDRLRGPCRPLP